MNKNLRLSDAIDGYLEHLRAKNRGIRTIKTHRQPLNRALELWGNIYVASIKPSHIDMLFADAPWGASTRNLYLGNLKGGFFPWLRRHGHIPRHFDPTDGWENVKVERKPALWIGVEEFTDLLEACDNARDRAVVALGLFTFCRGSEISHLRVQDLDFDNHLVHIYRIKTKEWDEMPMSLELQAEMLRWLHAYESEVGEPVQAHWYLVPARSALPMAYDFSVHKLQPTGEPARLKPTVPLGKPYDCVKRALARIGHTQKGTGAHTLRRSGARALFERLRADGYDNALRRTAAMLGHKNVSMTERYLGLELERRQRNELLAGQTMFPAMKASGVVRRLEVG